MKTKGLFQRYPRKISLLKDLARRHLEGKIWHKYMKTGWPWEGYSKISLLKDLARPGSAGVGICQI
jgi:hypothetical protein